jgi:hypothetical protein
MYSSLFEDTVNVPYLCLRFPLSVDTTQIVETLPLVIGTPRWKLHSEPLSSLLPLTVQVLVNFKVYKSIDFLC